MNRHTQSRRRAAVMMEAAMWIPILILFLFGMVELARVSYTYYTLQKILYTVARLAGSQQGVNFCDPEDTAVGTAKNYALRGGIEDDGNNILPDLQASQIEIRIERVDAEDGSLAECECSDSGCDASTGGGAPDYIVVSIPDGYPIRLVFPGLTLDPIPLRPQIRLPYGGT